MMENFKYCSMMYLNDWYSQDKIFMDGIASKSKVVSRDAFHKAAKYYKVTRNFANLENENRLEGALNLVLDVKEPITGANVSSKVTSLANEFNDKYGKYAVSAASKFLWLRYRSPVIIFDRRALTCLKNKGYKLSYGASYEEYRASWLLAYSDHEKEIDDACLDLPNIKDYSLAFQSSSDEVVNICQARWFKERVFDKYLWINADKSL